MGSNPTLPFLLLLLKKVQKVISSAAELSAYNGRAVGSNPTLPINFNTPYGNRTRVFALKERCHSTRLRELGPKGLEPLALPL